MIPENHNMMDLIIELAAYVLTRFSVGHDEMTAYERLTGLKLVRSMVEIGEVVLAKFGLPKLGYGKRKGQKNKLVTRAIKCVLVGQVSRTGEHIVV